jgi:hypothetical protein
MERQVGPIWIAACIVVALVVAIASTAALKLLATPSDHAQRLGALEQKTVRAERLAALPGDSAAYPKGAVCEGLGAEAFDRVRQKFDDAAKAEGLQGMQIIWGAPVEAGARIAPLPLSLRVAGPYDKVATFMDRLGRGAPALFVETADITAAGSGVELSLSGKVFCWTRG